MRLFLLILVVKDPQLICKGHSRFDVIQGKLGDCWLMAAAANLTLRDELFYRVVPPDQSFTENYAGIENLICHFNNFRHISFPILAVWTLGGCCNRRSITLFNGW